MYEWMLQKILYLLFLNTLHWEYYSFFIYSFINTAFSFTIIITTKTLNTTLMKTLSQANHQKNHCVFTENFFFVTYLVVVYCMKEALCRFTSFEQLYTNISEQEEDNLVTQAEKPSSSLRLLLYAWFGIYSAQLQMVRKLFSSLCWIYTKPST